MKAVGNPSLSSFLFTSSSPAVFNSCMLFSLSLSLCSLALCHPFWSLWESCGFQRVRKGQPTVLSKESRGINVCYHLSSLLCVNTAGVTVLTPQHLTPCCLYIVPSCSHAHRNAWATEQMHTLVGNACVHIHTYKNVRSSSVEPLLSDNHHTETNQGVPLLKAHPFLTLHIIEDSFWPKPKPAGVV